MKKKHFKAFKGEKIIWFIILLMLTLTPMLNVYTKAQLSETNIKVEQLKQNIENQSNVNESLSMKINELASLDKIREVASQEGLSYNNDNIKVIEDN